MKKYLLLFLLLALTLPLIASAVPCGEGNENNGLNLCYPSFGGITLTSATNLDGVIAWLYFFIVGIAGAAAFVMIVWGGITYLTSAGSPGQTADAKDRIQKALLGLLLILSSWLILQTINPELTIIKTPGTGGATTKAFTAPCDLSSALCEPSFTVNGEKDSTRVDPGDTVTLRWNVPNSRNCQAQAPPASLEFWDNDPPISTSGLIEDVGPLLLVGEPTTYSFTLFCTNQHFNETVNVIVSSEEPVVGEPPPTVDLKVALNLKGGDEPTDGPITYPDDFNNPNVANIGEFTWESNADICDIEGPLSNPSQGPSGSFTDSIAPPTFTFRGIPDPSEGITVLRYVITCTNISSGDTASDEVIITKDL